VLALELAPAEDQAPGGESTLDDLIVSAWEGLTARRVVACPACGEDLRPQYGAGAQPVGGRCEGCGSTLA